MKFDLNRDLRQKDHSSAFLSFCQELEQFHLNLILCPAAVNADEIDSSLIELDPIETVQAPREMTEKQMNDLFGEDPYLGQTSYLQSPDGFSQRKKSK